MPALTQRQVDIVEALYGLNINLARGDDNQRRQLTRKIDEQFCFEFGGAWGMKARAGGNIDDASKDSIAYLENDGTVSVWDWQNGTTREPQVHVGDEPNYPHLPKSEAAFIAVSPINHLQSENENEDDPIVLVLKDINENLKIIRADQIRLLGSQAATLEALRVLIDKPTPEIPPIKFPEYKASTFFGTITLKPQQ